MPLHLGSSEAWLWRSLDQLGTLRAGERSVAGHWAGFSPEALGPAACEHSLPVLSVLLALPRLPVKEEGRSCSQAGEAESGLSVQ